MEKAVLAPVSMRASSFSQPATQETLAIAAYGHDFLGEPEPFTSYVYPLMAAAGLWTTPSDLARFAIALQRAYFGKEGAVLTSGIAREMFNIQKNPSGLGVFISGEGHTKRFGHTGQAIGFDSEFLAYVETGQGAVVMINANDHSRTISRIFDAVASAYSWPDYSARVQAPPPAKADVLEDNDPHFTAQVREIFQRAAENGTYDATIFTKEGAAEISAPVEKWMKEIQGWGPLHAIELIGPAPRQPHNYLYRLSFEKYEILVYCERNEAGMISEFDLTYE
jgi:CubicO group peptidase (beta-lactamase class C family)